MPKITEVQKYVTWEHATYFPMYDHYIQHGGLYNSTWTEYKDIIIICFSKVLYQELKFHGLDARYLQYFPKPQKVQEWGCESSVFFWQRISKLNLCTLSEVVKNFNLTSIHYHQALDPGHSILPVSSDLSKKTEKFCQNTHFTESTWYDNKSQLWKEIVKHALYMAPRNLEGIGMSFLEAMAYGRCVIAPDSSTMNEYIKNGVTGFLYPWDPNTFTHCGASIQIPQLSIRQIQRNVHQFISEGYKKWVKKRMYILKWIQETPQTNTSKLEHCAILHGWKNYPIEQQLWPNTDILEKKLFTKQPTNISNTQKHIDVSIITVVFNAIKEDRRDMLLQCMNSVQSQTGVCIEHIIVDGASYDGTLDLIKSFDNRRHELRILSLKDNGIYEAMNRGIALAKGDYIAFLNSDDFYHNIYGLQASVNKLHKTGCSFSFAPVKVLNDSQPYNLHSYPYVCIDEIFMHAIFSHQSVLTDRKLISQLHGFDLSYQSAADYDFILRMILTGHRGCYVDKCFVTYRMIGISTTNQFRSSHETALIFKRLYNKYFHTDITEEDAHAIFTNKAFPTSAAKLKSRLKNIAKKAFVGLPYITSHYHRFYFSEVNTILWYIFTGRFTLLFHFLLILFNSRFNRTWYYLHYDLSGFKLSIAAHYLEKGWKEGKDPSPFFSTSHYLKLNPDVASMGICPLVHWKLKGKKEKRLI